MDEYFGSDDWSQVGRENFFKLFRNEEDRSGALSPKKRLDID